MVRTDEQNRLAHSVEGWKRVATSTGYAIEFETGLRMAYGQASSDINLIAWNLDGAEGNGRANVLNAGGSLKAVSIHKFGEQIGLPLRDELQKTNVGNLILYATHSQTGA